MTNSGKSNAQTLAGEIFMMIKQGHQTLSLSLSISLVHFELRLKPLLVFRCSNLEHNCLVCLDVCRCARYDSISDKGKCERKPTFNQLGCSAAHDHRIRLDLIQMSK